MSDRAPPEAVQRLLAAAAVEGAGIDVELPVKTRCTDEAGGALARLKRAAERPGPASLPFLARVLLAADSPLGLEVELKSDDRVVGVWRVDVVAGGEHGTPVARAGGHLYVCASAKGDARATGAFLVVRHWSVAEGDDALSHDLLRRLSAAVLQRLDALMGVATREPFDPMRCVLHLVDSRQLARRGLDLAALQATLIRDIEGEAGIAGIDLHVARGRAMWDSAILNSTMPGHLSEDEAASLFVTQAGKAFVPESVSPANVVWNRRASDKARSLARATHSRPASPSSDST